jgi:hypothetical protein
MSEFYERRPGVPLQPQGTILCYPRGQQFLVVPDDHMLVGVGWMRPRHGPFLLRANRGLDAACRAGRRNGSRFEGSLPKKVAALARMADIEAGRVDAVIGSQPVCFYRVGKNHGAAIAIPLFLFLFFF